MATSLDLAIQYSMAEAAPAVPKQGSFVVKVLVSLLGWGIISSVVVQRIAAAVLADFEAVGATAPLSLQKFALFGTNGEHSRNCRRDLRRYLKPYLITIPTWQMIRVPFVKARSRHRHIIEYMSMPIHMPNLLFEELYQNFPDYFAQMMGRGLNWFWSQVICWAVGVALRRLLKSWLGHSMHHVQAVSTIDLSK
jgi:hypothetical protein